MAGPRQRQTSPDTPDAPPAARLTGESLRDLASLYRYLRPYLWMWIGGLLALFASSLTTLAFPKVIGEMVDAALKGESKLVFGLFPNTVNNLALLLVGALVLQASFSFLRIIWFVTVAEKSLADLRRDLYRNLITLPMNFFGQRRVGELTNRISSDVDLLQDTLTMTLAEFLRSLLNFLIGVVFILSISPALSLVMLSTFPVLMVAAVLLGRIIRRLSRESRDKLAEAQVVVEESLQGIQVVKSFANEPHERGRYGAILNQVVGLNLKTAKYRGGFVSFVILALFGSIVLVFWYGSTLVQRGEVTVGELTSFLFFTMLVGVAVGGFGEQYAQLLRTIGATERVRELLRETPEPIHTDDPAIARPQGLVAFVDVGFRYASRPELAVLEGVHLNARPGETIALVGPSGAGKSTLVSLLLRFYQPTHGRILLDGKDLQDYPLHQLRNHMAVVPQEVQLFGGTIRENIAYGQLTANEAEIVAAARQANAWDFIASFPQGLDTVVGERGVKLSGGQRQRIAIARAVLRNPAILILDEATSSLDSESEHLVQQALEQLMQGRTTFVIAHRLSTIRNAHQIVVLEQGRVAEQGTHEQLMANPSGLYRMLASLQYQTEELAKRTAAAVEG